MNETQIQRETRQVVEDVLEKTNLKQGVLFVLGLSSSEVLGGQIGKESSQEIGELIVETILGILGSRGIHLAVQGCEHVNRALVVERQVAEQFDLKLSVSILLFMQEVRGSWQPLSLCRIQLRLNLSRLMLDWISETLQLACMSSMFRFRFALF